MRKILNRDKDEGSFLESDVRTQLKLGLKKTLSVEEALTLISLGLINTYYHELRERIDTEYFSVYEESRYKNLYTVFKLFGLQLKVNKKSTFDLNSTWRANGLNHRDILRGDMRELMLSVKKEIRYTHIDDLEENITTLVERKRKRNNNNLETDMTFIYINAQKDAFDELDIPTVTFTAILDDRTSVYCQDANGTVIFVDEIVPGDNAPPLHYNCRSYLVPNFDDSFLEYLLDKGFTLEELNFEEWMENL